MQIIQYRTPKPKRPLLVCSACGKPGYRYVRFRRSHRHVYTKHFDEPPIGFYSNGKPKYRACYEGGRLYNSIEEALAAEKSKIIVNIKPQMKAIPKKPIVRRARVNCPRCHKRGRLDRAPVSSKTPEIKRFYIDHKTVNKIIDRCYMRKGEEIELAERLWNR
jgi:hypothetical protein